MARTGARRRTAVRPKGGGSAEVTSVRQQLAEWGGAIVRAQRPPATGSATGSTTRAAGGVEAVARAAKEAFGARVPPSDVVSLIWDSDTDRREGFDRRPPDGAPSAATSRVLWFGTDGLGIELEVLPPAPGGRRLTGRVMPPGTSTVVLDRGAGAAVPVRPDDAGRFAVDGVAGGLLRLRVARPGRRDLVTAWVLLD